MVGNNEKDIKLRDWFAGQALVGLLANAGHGSEDPFEQTASRAVDRAYLIAAAMMKQHRKLEKEDADTW